MKIIDLTYTFGEKMPTYCGDPAPRLRQFTTIAKDGYADCKLHTTLHVGTHIDAPAHMVEGGKRIDELPLEQFCGRGVIVDVRRQKEIDRASMSFQRKLESRIVLFCTDWSKKYRSEEYFTDFPVMTEQLARELVKKKVKMVGFDTPSPDRRPFAVHHILLGAGVLIIENLTNLEVLLPHRRFEILAFPMKLAADAAPARVVVVEPISK